ncbi:TonB-dependent receptor [Hymenobacter sp. NST-14]|uniref:TonB-dependent receptor n=1 Tax=Hymenobacter piscis TaxID=2839984 RepID=UPI001C02EC76|nr:TonB-dependent receptor [Hymenobacter piscis]MBT9393286.1 TonB-dependent receptor [Hymenobacter piscis]
MRRIFLLFFFLTISHLLWAQQGTLAGKILDQKTGEGAIGATVIVTGTTTAAPVELDGTYSLSVTPGTYTISVQSIGYKSLTFPGIVIQAGQKTTLNGSLEENAQALKEVVVTGQKQTGTEVAMIQDLKKAEVVVSGMSNDQIVKTMDRDASEVVKRIPGVTIQSNNFVVVRGLAERYNTVMLNDALTPSAETDTRAFSFDILPSSVIDRVLIFKSGSPDLPGEFAGGVVKVYTKNSVLENSTSFSLSSSYRAGTTFQDFSRTQGSSTDALGFDSGQRALPDQTPGSVVVGQGVTRPEAAAFGQSLRNDWVARTGQALPDLRLSLGLLRKYEIGSAYLSNVTSLSYSNTREQYNVTRNDYELQREDDGRFKPKYEFIDRQSNTNVRLGLIHNWQLRLNDRHRLEFRNFLNQMSQDQVVARSGAYLERDQDRRDFALRYQSRTIYSGQLQGTHEVAPRTTLTWLGGYNYVNRNEPDYRRYRSLRYLSDPDTEPFRIQLPAQGNLFEASRFFSTLTENTVAGSAQLEHRWAGRDTTKANEYKLRVGAYAENKDRGFDARFFSNVRGNEETFDRSIEQQGIETIFRPENFDPVTGLIASEGTRPTDNYEGSNRLLASYVSLVAPLSDKFNVSGGVRLENNRRRIEVPSASEFNGGYTRTVVLPSLNAAYNFTQRSLLRLAGSTTVNRPEFREMARFQYFDFANNWLVEGNERLREATIYNADLRYEFYPSRSEMISVAAFYKHFDRPVESIILEATGDLLTLGYVNARQAYDYGLEVEARKTFAESSSAVLRRLGVVFNASLIKSNVRLDEEANSSQIQNRALQGQSPYVINTGLFYQDDERGWQTSVQYNVIGPRIAFVGNRDNGSLYEVPRNVLDLTVTKTVARRLDVRVGIQDVLNQPTRLVRDNDFNQRVTSADPVFSSFRRGSYYTLGVVYRLTAKR